MSLQIFDPAIARLIDRERNRQENPPGADRFRKLCERRSAAQAQGSVLTNKYAEGYPGKRYYGGCKVVDEIENLAIQRARKLFNCEYVNVQPHSGSQANQAVFLAVLEPGNTIIWGCPWLMVVT